MADIDAKIKAQGDKIRELKNAKTAKDVIDPEQKILLACSCYKGVRGDHCIHKLATEMFLGERQKPSEEKN